MLEGEVVSSAQYASVTVSDSSPSDQPYVPGTVALQMEDEQD